MIKNIQKERGLKEGRGMKIKRGREMGREENECYCSVILGVGEIARM